MRYGVEARGVQSKVDTNEQREGKKTNNGAKKKQNNGLNRMHSICKKNRKIQTREMSTKKRGMESKNTTKQIVLPKIINI